jgi:catechol 2,3-dioxygenase-like lactoylglutathione lyase family enzyme
LSTENIARNGFSHIGITVPNYEEALKRFKNAGVKFIKDRGEDITAAKFGLPEDTPTPLDEGFFNAVREITFIEDPDGYCVEIMAQHR